MRLILCFILSSTCSEAFSLLRGFHQRRTSLQSKDQMYDPADVYAAIPSKEKRFTLTDSISLPLPFKELYELSLNDPERFWNNQAGQYLEWQHPYETISGGGFEEGDYNWFEGGKINACYNCIDKHLPDKADKVAIIWEKDEVGEAQKITFKVR